jgi:serine/threonine-protein kinase
VLILQSAMFVNNVSILVVGVSFIGLAYAVARHRVLGIHVVLRRGLQYLFAKNVLRLVVSLPLLIVLSRAIVTDRGLKDLLLRSSWPFYLAIAVTGAVSLCYRRQMGLWLDQKFFRVALQQESALAALTERLRNIESEEELWLMAGSELTQALHVNGCHVFLRDQEGHIRIAYSQLPDRAARLRRWLSDQAREFEGPGSPFVLYEMPDAATSDTASAPGPTEYLVVPAMGTDPHGIGTLVLGPKRSEQPYTARDRVLLRAIAGQMAIMYEVLSLKQSVAQERRVRVQVLGHLDHQNIQLLNECPECGRCYTIADSVCTADGASLSLTLPVERTIDAKYRLERRIGRGGMGVVYRGQDTRLDRAVAIKIMTGDLFGNTAAMARFEREARAAAMLKHPNIVAVHDFGRLPTGGGYLVMELIDGKSWREFLKLGRGIQERASRWMTQLCLAVEAAHAGGVVHRDLKPENVMLVERDGDPDFAKVLDFGIAKVSGTAAAPEGKALTRVGAVIGTPDYMSPEQAVGEAVDARSDLYSAGVILYEMLAGHRPYRGGAVTVLRQHVLSAVPDLPLASTATIDHRIVTVLRRMLAKAPEDRFASASELMAALDGCSTPSRPPVSPGVPLPAVPGGGTSATRRVRLIVAAAAVAVVATILVVALGGRSKSETAAAPAISEAPASAEPPHEVAPPSAVAATPPSSASPDPAAALPPPPAPSSGTATGSQSAGAAPARSAPAQTRSRRTGPGGIYIPPPSQWFK